MSTLVLQITLNWPQVRTYVPRDLRVPGTQKLEILREIPLARGLFLRHILTKCHEEKRTQK